MRFTRSPWLVGAVAVVAMMVSACSGSSTDSSGTGSGGGPIKIGFIGTTESQVYNFAESGAAVQARVDAQNKAAGSTGAAAADRRPATTRPTPTRPPLCPLRQVRRRRRGRRRCLCVGNALAGALDSAGIVYTGNAAAGPCETNAKVSFRSSAAHVLRGGAGM